jgi:hypothetical protein
MIRRLSAIVLAAISMSCAGAAEPAPEAAPAAHAPQPHSNLAQMMRGIPFTFANIVFDAQSEDPGRTSTAAGRRSRTARWRSPRRPTW